VPPCPAPLQVAVIDDDLAVRRALGRALTACGAEVRDFASAEEALAELRPGEVDLIVTDLDLPGLDGAGLIAAARAEGHRCPAVVVSGELAEHHPERLAAVDAFAVLSKPFTLDSVRELVSACRRGAPARD